MGKLVILNFVILILGIYRSGNGNFDNFFQRFDAVLNRVNGPNKGNRANIVILGDLNINSLCTNRLYMDFSDLVKVYDLDDVLATVPTRLAHNSVGSSIGHVITNAKNFEAYVVDGGISDHFGQVIDVFDDSLSHVNIKSSIRRTSKRSFSDKNVNSLKMCLDTESWENVYSSNDVNVKWENFAGTLQWYLDWNCPKKSVKVNVKNSDSNGNKLSNKVRLSNETLKLKEDMLYQSYLFKQTGNLAFKDSYKQLKNKFRLEVRNEKASLIKSKIDSSQNVSKSAWALVNNLRLTNVRHETKG
ncbi:uncharacterized protein LOC128982861 isoform X2 [Macrosteles quadrilineatus]|uniref:uncharacterized protein LOC128982861 isoform X2 n=1 Tax=Macrosteles quadrilineatus TaxID=74068 RepID=UPI0023E14976|nr:uncharacterized protein LOC128982861 isoform X2 [Macrosteles quadrilineatus]